MRSDLLFTMLERLRERDLPLAAYAAALEVIVPGARVEAALLYTAAARLIVLPEDQLAPVKRRLAGPEQSLGLDG